MLFFFFGRLFVLSVCWYYCCLFVQRTSREKKKTQHITSFLFFLPKPGEKKLHFCTIACHEMLRAVRHFYRREMKAPGCLTQNNCPTVVTSSSFHDFIVQLWNLIWSVYYYFFTFFFFFYPCIVLILKLALVNESWRDLLILNELADGTFLSILRQNVLRNKTKTKQ